MSRHRVRSLAAALVAPIVIGALVGWSDGEGTRLLNPSAAHQSSGPAAPPSNEQRRDAVLSALRGELPTVLGAHPPAWLKPYEVATTAMAPTLVLGDRVITDRLAYSDGRQPQPGEVIAFTPRGSAARSCAVRPGGPAFIKRVIGVAGDEVIVRDGTTFVNGIAFEVDGAQPPEYERRFPRVPAGRLIVLGDNRPSSCDSHVFEPDPFVSVDDVIGRVEGIYAPRSRVGLLRPGGGIEPIAIPDPAARRRFDFLLETTDLPSRLAQPLGLLPFCATHRSCRQDVGRLMSSLAGELGGEIRRDRRVARRFGDPCTRLAGASLRAGLLRDRRALVRAKRSARGARALAERVLARYPRVLRHATFCE